MEFRKYWRNMKRRKISLYPRQDIENRISSKASHSAGSHMLRILGKSAVHVQILNIERVTYQQKMLTWKCLPLVYSSARCSHPFFINKITKWINCCSLIHSKCVNCAGMVALKPHFLVMVKGASRQQPRYLICWYVSSLFLWVVRWMCCLILVCFVCLP